MPTKVNIFGDNAVLPQIADGSHGGDAAAVFSQAFLDRYGEGALNIFNLEVPLTRAVSAATKVGPRLKGDPDMASILSAANLSLATLANNHMMDFGVEGLRDTEAALRRHHIGYVGASSSGSQNAHCVREMMDGIRVSVINVSEQEFGVVKPGQAGVQMEDTAQLYYWIAEEKRSSDSVILIVHGGSEYFSLPSPKRKQRARLYVDFGADAVIYHHTHVVSAFEEYQGRPIFYGLGNFLFFRPGSGSAWNTGMVATLSIDGSPGGIWGEPGYVRYVPGSGVCLLEHPELDEMIAKVAALNEVLSDDRKWAEAWEQFCDKRRRGVLRLTNLIPRWQGFLLRKGVLKRPLFHNNSLLGGLNVLRCAAHHEVAETIFESEARKRFKKFV